VTQSVGDYLASIDWLGGVLLGALLIGTGLVVLRFLMASSAELGAMLPGWTRAAGRRILDERTAMPVDSWVCSACRSVNTPTASLCYRGCGRREDLARPLPDDPSVTADVRNGGRP
jgi:hypothetical protein